MRTGLIGHNLLMKWNIPRPRADDSISNALSSCLFLSKNNLQQCSTIDQHLSSKRYFLISIETNKQMGTNHSVAYSRLPIPIELSHTLRSHTMARLHDFHIHNQSSKPFHTQWLWTQLPLMISLLHFHPFSQTQKTVMSRQFLAIR